MKRKRNAVRLLLLLPVLILAMAGCTDAQEKPEETVPETITETAVPETTAIPTEAETEPPTEAVTEAPREPGPQQLEGNAAAIRDVTVEFVPELPREIKSSTTYSASGFQEEFELNDSQVYARIRFTLTNRSEKEIEVADIHDDFLVELIYDDRYVYTPDSNSWCFFRAGSQTAVVSDMASIGEVSLAPLSTKEVTVYLPCAKEVSENQDKHLLVIFTSNYSGYENFEFIIR